MDWEDGGSVRLRTDEESPRLGVNVWGRGLESVLPQGQRPEHLLGTTSAGHMASPPYKGSQDLWGRHQL